MTEIGKIEVLFAVILSLSLSGCTMGSGMSRGSDKVLFSVADELRFSNADLGKSIRLRLNQKLIISLAPEPGVEGKWSIEHVDRQKFLLLSQFVRGESGLNTVWLYEARAYGYFSFTLIYTPYDKSLSTKEYKTSVVIEKIQ